MSIKYAWFESFERLESFEGIYIYTSILYIYFTRHLLHNNLVVYCVS